MAIKAGEHCLNQAQLKFVVDAAKNDKWMWAQEVELCEVMGIMASKAGGIQGDVRRWFLRVRPASKVSYASLRAILMIKLFLLLIGAQNGA